MIAVLVYFVMNQDTDQHFFEVVLEHYYLVNGKESYEQLMRLMDEDSDKAFDILDEFVGKYQESILLNIISDNDVAK